MRSLFRIFTIPLVATAIAAAQTSLPPAPNSSSTPLSRNGPENESQLAQEVRHNLLLLPYYSIFDELDYSVNGSVVTLAGLCPPDPPWDIRSEAAAAVKRVKGVTQVVNNIKLLPLSPMDWQIRRAEERAIYGNPEIGMRYGYQVLPPIHIIVDNGHVTLEGIVANQSDDTLIRIHAREVPNVFSVTDKLTVLNPGKKKEK